MTPPSPALQNDLLMMASLCERNLRNSLGCLLNRDEDLCNVTIADDEEIDQLEKQVDKNGIDLLRRFQPVASDLRHVIAAMKLSGNLERIADQAVNIARKARKLNRAPLLPEVHFPRSDVPRGDLDAQRRPARVHGVQYRPRHQHPRAATRRWTR